MRVYSQSYLLQEFIKNSNKIVNGIFKQLWPEKPDGFIILSELFKNSGSVCKFNKILMGEVDEDQTKCYMTPMFQFALYCLWYSLIRFFVSWAGKFKNSSQTSNRNLTKAAGFVWFPASNQFRLKVKTRPFTHSFCSSSVQVFNGRMKFLTSIFYTFSNQSRGRRQEV